MKGQMKQRKLYTIKEDRGRFKVYDKDGKYRQSFATYEQAELFAQALTVRGRR